MKYTFLVNQAGVVRCGLLGHVDLTGLCLLDYLSSWFFSPKAKRITVEGKEYVWIAYQHAVDELPMLFSPEAAKRSRKNQLSRIVCCLRDAGLVESVNVRRDLFIRPSELANRIANSRESTITKSTPSVTLANDDTVTPERDDTVTQTRDDSGGVYINEETIKKQTIMEATYPHSPPPGDGVNCKGSSLSEAEKIYDAYPRKVGRPAALRAIQRALGKHPFEFLDERTRLFALTYNGPAEFIPHATTFFNQQRFLDDPATWRRSSVSDRKVNPTVLRGQSFGCGVSKLD